MVISVLNKDGEVLSFIKWINKKVFVDFKVVLRKRVIMVKIKYLILLNICRFLNRVIFLFIYLFEFWKLKWVDINRVIVIRIVFM